MRGRDLIYWLQGFFEISGAEELSKEQVVLIQKHLALVFKHEIDLGMGDDQWQGNELGVPHGINRALGGRTARLTRET